MAVLTARWLVVVVILTLLPIGTRQVGAQRASAYQLTAAFLLNFVKFTTWPDGALSAQASIVLCVIDNDRVADALGEVTRGQTVAGRPIEVRRTTLAAAVGTCQVIYGGDTDGGRGQPLIQATQGRPILTVGASSDFAERGGVANFFVDNGRMRFAVNTTAADKARLRISSKLLSLAKIVHHDGRS